MSSAVTGGGSRPTIYDVARLTLMVASASEDAALERTQVEAFLRRGISGLILAPAPGGDHSYLRAPMENGVGVAFIDRRPVGLSADTVTIDNERGGFLATRHLIEGDHTRIMAVGGPERAETIRDRVRGICERCGRAG